MSKKKIIYIAMGVIAVVLGYLNYFGSDKEVGDIRKIIETVNAVYESDDYHVEAEKEIDYIDEKEKAFNFKRVFMVNPPVELYDSAVKLDKYLDDYTGGKSAGIERLLNTTLARVKGGLTSEYANIGADTIYEIVKGDILSEAEKKAYIGLAFRLTSTDLNFISDFLTKSHIYTKNPEKVDKFTNMKEYFKAVNFATFEDYVNKTMGTEQGVLGLFAATDERDKTTSFIVEIYNDYLAFSNHTKNQTSKDFKAVIPQIADGNLNSTEVDIQIAKDKKIEQNENTFTVYTVIDVKPENNKEFTEIIKNRAETTFNENGVLLIYVGTDRRNPNKWCLFEVYSDIDSYLNHRASSYFKEFITQTKDMITEQKRYELQPLKLINKGGLDYKKLY